MKYFDKNGIEIEHLDVLKVYHFTGARRKKHYMYKQAIIKDGQLTISHLMGKGSYHPSHLVSTQTEIVQSRNWEKL